MLYLIGLGLTTEDISLKAKKICENADKVYLESYTVDFPYSIEDLEKIVDAKIEPLERNNVESDKIVKEAKDKEIVLLVYGSPLIATTHISIILEAKDKNIGCRVIHNASVLDGIANTGLQSYKFGKTASLPDWDSKGKSKSFMDVILNNKKIGAHTLLLVDIGLELDDAVDQLKKSGYENEKIIVCSKLGYENEKIYFDKLDKLEKININKPYCIIIPGKFHFTEKEALEQISEKAKSG